MAIVQKNMTDEGQKEGFVRKTKEKSEKSMEAIVGTALYWIVHIAPWIVDSRWLLDELLVSG